MPPPPPPPPPSYPRPWPVPPPPFIPPPPPPNINIINQHGQDGQGVIDYKQDLRIETLSAQVYALSSAMESYNVDVVSSMISSLVSYDDLSGYATIEHVNDVALDLDARIEERTTPIAVSGIVTSMITQDDGYYKPILSAVNDLIDDI